MFNSNCKEVGGYPLAKLTSSANHRNTLWMADSEVNMRLFSMRTGFPDFMAMAM